MPIDCDGPREDEDYDKDCDEEKFGIVIRTRLPAVAQQAKEGRRARRPFSSTPTPLFHSSTKLPTKGRRRPRREDEDYGKDYGKEEESDSIVVLA